MELDYETILMKRALGIPGQSLEPHGTSRDPAGTPLGPLGPHARPWDPSGTPLGNLPDPPGLQN